MHASLCLTCVHGDSGGAALKRGNREAQLDSTFLDENFMTLNLDRLLVSVRITAAARTLMNYRRRREIPACSDETEGARESRRGRGGGVSSRSK